MFYFSLLLCVYLSHQTWNISKNITLCLKQVYQLHFQCKSSQTCYTKEHQILHKLVVLISDVGSKKYTDINMIPFNRLSKKPFCIWELKTGNWSIFLIYLHWEDLWERAVVPVTHCYISWVPLSIYLKAKHNITKNQDVQAEMLSMWICSVKFSTHICIYIHVYICIDFTYACVYIYVL